MSTPLLTHLVTWSAQVLLLTAAGALAALTLTNARAKLFFWQGLLLAMLLLPVVEPWKSGPLHVLNLPEETHAPVPVALVKAVGTVGAPQSARRWQSEDWLMTIAVGAAVRLIWILVGFLHLRGYRQEAELLPQPTFRFDATFARWYVSHTVPGPVTYGWRNPSILLPSRVMRLPQSLREAIACHELVHVHRRDWLFVLAEEAVRTLLWFHPAVWFVLSRIQLAREQVVDREVVRLTKDRDGYLNALVEVAANRLLPDLAPAPLFLRKRHLAVRVSAVLKEVSMSRPRIAARLAAAISAMFVAARVAIWFVPFVSPAQTIYVVDDPGVTVEAGGMLLHRAPVHHPVGLTATLAVEASLNAKGEVTDAHVLTGPDDLRKEALASVLQWHYSPGLSRVQISMRFDPVGPTPAAQSVIVAAQRLPSTSPGGRGGRSGGSNAAPFYPANLARIEFAGFSPEGEQQLRNRLNVHEGDAVSSTDMERLRQIVSDFDGHAFAVLTQNPGSAGKPEAVLRIGVTDRPFPVFTSTTALSPNGYLKPNDIPPFADRPVGPAPSLPGPPPGVYEAGNGVSPPVPLFSPQPAYSERARTAKFQGTVTLSLTVDESGQATNVQVTRPLGMGLDENAVQAAQQWRFKPGLKDGQPVKVMAAIQMTFRLLPNGVGTDWRFQWAPPL